MATNIDIVITDLTGCTFIVKLNWDIDCMKQSISTDYEIKLFNEYLNINNISKNEYYKNTNHAYIELIYNNKILEQYDVESDLFTDEMIKENNNMSFVIVKKEPINYEDDTD